MPTGSWLVFRLLQPLRLGKPNATANTPARLPVPHIQNGCELLCYRKNPKIEQYFYCSIFFSVSCCAPYMQMNRNNKHTTGSSAIPGVVLFTPIDVFVLWHVHSCCRVRDETTAHHFPRKGISIMPSENPIDYSHTEWLNDMLAQRFADKDQRRQEMRKSFAA